MLKFLKNDTSNTYQDLSENFYRESASTLKSDNGKQTEISFDFSLQEKIQEELEASELKNLYTLPPIGKIGSLRALPSLPSVSTKFSRAMNTQEH